MLETEWLRIPPSPLNYYNEPVIPFVWIGNLISLRNKIINIG